MRPPAAGLGILLASCAGPAPERAFGMEVEGGGAWFSRNDVAVPGDTGTQFPLDDLTGDGPTAVGRVYLTWRPAARHELRGLIAPLRISGTGSLGAPVSFAGADFAAGVPTHASYRFDSYRLTYRYLLHDGEAWDWRIGVTGNIRDAEIELQQGDVGASKANVGIVPLLHGAADWQCAEAWRLSLDVDGAWAPQGRALDAAFKVYWTLGKGLELGVGYRTIEGGAENDEVFTFAWIHEAVVSLRYDF